MPESVREKIAKTLAETIVSFLFWIGFREIIMSQLIISRLLENDQIGGASRSKTCFLMLQVSVI